MADLSGVLRKTIDGLPQATPQMRAKVYDKARAAIQRQVEAANPPLADEVIGARFNALEDAIARTEQYYSSQDDGPVQPDTTHMASSSGLANDTAGRRLEEPSADVRRTSTTSLPQQSEPYPPQVRADRRSPEDRGFFSPDEERRPSSSPIQTRRDESPSVSGAGGSQPRRDPPFFPLTSEEPEAETGRPSAVGGPFIVPSATGNDGFAESQRRLPAGIRSDDDIPEADVSGPRYTGRRRKARGPGKAALLGGVALILIAGIGTAAWLYRDDLTQLLVEPTEVAGVAAPSSENTEAPPSNASSNPDDEGEAATDAAEGEATPPASEPTSNREFTQRLLPDGSEADTGPAAPAPNAFDEGTDVAAASPLGGQEGGDGTSPTVSSEIGAAPTTAGATQPSSGAASTPATPAEADTAAPAVGQKAVFYQEKTDAAPGTQEVGNVVWSVVNEPPSEGQAPEPAIRAVADIPDENLKMTMTIRRNADPTLPASHVIEIMFDTPNSFAGGGVANVQRLALKPTEQARGEPLIGVAGKISDGFFIIALNNLDEATKTNLNLLSNQQWIDIPMAYATGRRALMSIEKGIPGDRAFKEAMNAWAAKT